MKRLSMIPLLLLLLFTAACARETEATPTYRKINGAEALELMKNGHILLDVRTDDEYREQRLSGAVLIPDYELANRAEDELPDKDALILIYCRSGRRSALAAQTLLDLGYTNVYDFGGIIDWEYDTVNG